MRASLIYWQSLVQIQPAPQSKEGLIMTQPPYPGCYGVSHGSGIIGELIRHATDSWAGHAFIYIGSGQIIEGTPPVAKASAAASHPDAIWNINESMTDKQRTMIVSRAHALIGCPYDYPAYIGFALEILKLRTGQQLDPVFHDDNWRVCSSLVADCYRYAGIQIDPSLKDPNLVTPADLYSRIK